MIPKLWNILSLVLLVIGISFSLEQQAHAYADPGSGLLIFQAAASVLTGAFYVCNKRIRSLFSKNKPAAEVEATHSTEQPDDAA